MDRPCADGAEVADDGGGDALLCDRLVGIESTLPGVVCGVLLCWGGLARACSCWWCCWCSCCRCCRCWCWRCCWCCSWGGERGRVSASSEATLKLLMRLIFCGGGTVGLVIVVRTAVTVMPDDFIMSGVGVWGVGIGGDDVWKCD